MNTLIKILQETLIGKSVEVCVESNRIMEPQKGWIKATQGTTDKQFLSGKPQYRKEHTRQIYVRTEHIYKRLKIVDVSCEGDSYEGYNTILQLENDKFVSMTDAMMEQDINQLTTNY